MNNNLTEIAVSLLCCKSEWNRLFADGIIPFVTDIDLSASYTIKFNYDDEENIRLSLYTTEINAKQLAEKAAEYFKDWFLKANLIVPEMIPVGEEAPIPFPINSIQFGSYHREEKENLSLSVNLSQIILDALKEDVIDDETILTFAFYLQICLIKLITQIDPGFINTLKPAFKDAELGEPENADTNHAAIEGQISKVPSESMDAVNSFIMERISLNEKFEEYKAGLLEITSDVMNSADEADILGWLKLWLNTCKTELNRPVENENIIITYKRIIDTVYGHLGIAPETNAMLSYFVQRALGLMNQPGVIIMGAQKSGTSTLHHTLVTHSNINGPVDPVKDKPVKEVNFWGSVPKWKKGMDWYFSHFTGTKGLFLDSSPNYISSPYCFERMCKIVPDAKLIICIRDPVKRAYSQYNHYKQVLPESEKWDWKYEQDFLTNIKTELLEIKKYLEKGHKNLDQSIAFSYIILRGVYICQIKHLLNYYDRSQIYITITDRWPQSYQNELDNIQNFLGLKIESLSPKIRNKREYTFEPFDEEAKQLLTEFYKPYNQELFEFLGYEIPEWN